MVLTICQPVLDSLNIARNTRAIPRRRRSCLTIRADHASCHSFYNALLDLVSNCDFLPGITECFFGMVLPEDFADSDQSTFVQAALCGWNLKAAALAERALDSSARYAEFVVSEL